MKDNPDKFEKPTEKKNIYNHDGLEYIINFIPEIDSQKQTNINNSQNLYPKSTSSKSIEYNSSNNSKIISY